MLLTLRYKWHSLFNNLIIWITCRCILYHYMLIYWQHHLSSSLVQYIIRLHGDYFLLYRCFSPFASLVSVAIAICSGLSSNSFMEWTSLLQTNGRGCPSHNLYWPQFVRCSWREIRNIWYDSCNITITVQSEWRLLLAWCLLGMFPR